MIETTATGVEIAAGAPPVPETPQLTLSMLLAALNQADNMAVVEFDPAALVGDLRDKVDAIHHVLTRMASQEQWAREMAAPFQKAAQALARNQERLKSYVVYAMQQQSFAQLPGNAVKIRLRDSTPALKVLKGEPNANDFMAYPEYVEPIRGYRWRTDEIKKDLQSGALTFPEPKDGEAPAAFAKITRGQWAEFVPNTDKIESKRGKK